MPDEPFAPESADRDFARDQIVRDWLRKPFRPEQIGKLPASRNRPALDFVGHAAVTDRLNKLVPGWFYTIDHTFQLEDSFWLQGTITIGGVSRPEYGDGKDPKEALGNFIRRGAMRFGVAIDLWSREELAASEGSVLGKGTPSDQAGEVDTTSHPGEVSPGAADRPEPGDRSSRSIPPASGTYPLDPSECDHKMASGAWVRWRVVDAELPDNIRFVCPKCGTPKLVAMEGTTEDLGPA